MSDSIQIFASCGILISLYVLWYLRPNSGLKDIPGPPRRPLIGNLLDWPSEYQGERVNEWKKVFGQFDTFKIIFQHLLTAKYSRRAYDQALCIRKDCYLSWKRKIYLRVIR